MKPLIITIILAFICTGCGGSDGAAPASTSNGSNSQLKFDNTTNLFNPTEAYSTATTYHQIKIWNANGSDPAGDASGAFRAYARVNGAVVIAMDVPSVAKGGYVIIQLAIDRSLYPAGVYNVSLELDVDNVVGETNEHDNIHNESVTITASPLVAAG